MIIHHKRKRDEIDNRPLLTALSLLLIVGAGLIAATFVVFSTVETAPQTVDQWAAVQSAQAQWAEEEPFHYAYTVRYRMGDVDQRVWLRVMGDTVREIRRVAPDEGSDLTPAEAFPYEMDSLFTWVRQYTDPATPADTYDYLTVQYDETLGYPTAFWFMSCGNQGTITRGFEIEAFTILDPRT